MGEETPISLSKTPRNRLRAWVQQLISVAGDGSGCFRPPFKEETLMKTWNKPQVSEQVVGLEVTSYMPAEIDII